jgi:hypothetical protein
MFYRGADVRSLNSNEFARGRITGEPIDVAYAEMGEQALTENWQAQGIHNLSEYITEYATVDITGGLTETLSAAIKFTDVGDYPGVVLHIDESRISTPITPIEYDPGWFDRNPGVLGHVITLGDGEIHVNDRILGLTDAREGNTIIYNWGRGRVENEATANRYATESEVVAFANEIDLGSSVRSMAAYLGTTGVSPYTVTNALTILPGYRSSIGTIKNTQTGAVVGGPEDYRAHAEALYEAMVEAIEYDTARFYIVGLESRNDVRNGDERIDHDNFRWVYNGREFDTDYQRNSHLLGWGR